MRRVRVAKGRLYSEKGEEEHQKSCIRDTCTPLFITALFTMANCGISLGAHQLMNRKRKCDDIYVHIHIYTQHNRVLFCHKEE
jgi:hypothetical protein